MNEPQPASADGAEGRLAYLVENLTSLHAAQNQAWIASRFEFLGEKVLGAALTVLALPDESGAYRATASASARPAVARDWWDELELDSLASNTAAAATFANADSAGRAATYDLAEIFPHFEREAPERAIVAPIAFNRESIGAGIFVIEPDSSTESLAAILASHAAVAIHQLREREEARRLHSVDARLWVPDEDFLITQLRREVARARRYGREVGVALLRFDSETAVREKYGDFYADHVMRRIGSQLVIDIRDSDVIGAYDGAYAVIHTETPLDGTQLSSERLRDKVVKMLSQRFPELADPQISVCTAAFPESGATADELLEHLHRRDIDATPASDLAA